MDENKFLWEGNTADGKPLSVTFEQIVDPLDPDGDPDVRIVIRPQGSAIGGVHTVLPGNALLAYVAELIRTAKIEELREMDDEDVLGLPSYDFDDGDESEESN